TTSQIPCIIDVRAPDARVERPVSCAQRRSKTSVTTNRSATAVNSAISVIVRSLIDLAVARWEPEGTGHRSDIAGRMLANVALDCVVGAVPVFGDAFDVMWRANRRNVRLLREWLGREKPFWTR